MSDASRTLSSSRSCARAGDERVRGALPPLPPPDRRVRAPHGARRGPRRGLTQDAFLVRAAPDARDRLRDRLPALDLRDRAQRGDRHAPPRGPRREVSIDARASASRPPTMLRYGAGSGPRRRRHRPRAASTHLRGALDELSEPHHEIIVLRELEGLSYREIGERMELSDAAVESTLFRARRQPRARVRGARHRPPLRRDRASLIARIAGGHRGRARPAPSSRATRAAARPAAGSAPTLGIEPAPSRAARAAALVPVPGVMRRRGRRRRGLTGGAQQGIAAGALVAPAAPADRVEGGLGAGGRRRGRGRRARRSAASARSPSTARRRPAHQQTARAAPGRRRRSRRGAVAAPAPRTRDRARRPARRAPALARRRGPGRARRARAARSCRAPRRRSLDSRCRRPAGEGAAAAGDVRPTPAELDLPARVPAIPARCPTRSDLPRRGRRGRRRCGQLGDQAVSQLP